MSTVVYQGLQSQLMADSRTLIKLKLASQSPNFFPLSFELDYLKSHRHRFLDLDSLSDSSSSFKLMKETPHQLEDHNNNILTSSSSSSSQTPNDIKAAEATSFYVHPLFKTSPASLGFKSLELCTENLGSETGTELVEDDVVFSFSRSSDIGNVKPSSSCGGGGRRRRNAQSSYWEGKKKVKTFPPPLTTMGGSDCLRVSRPHREDGRLVINAVKTPIKSSCFQAQRCHGRLLLRFVENTNDGNNEQNVEAKSEDGHHGNESRFANDDRFITGNDEYPDEEDRNDDNDEDALSCLVGDMDGNKLDSGVKMGIEELQRQQSSSSRTYMCQEGGSSRNKDGLMLSLEACWLATSS